MDASPLTKLSRPETFQPKIVQLYEALFQPVNVESDEPTHEHSDGFWEEFFLLRPEASSLRHVLQGLSPDQMLHLQVPAQQLVSHAIDRVHTARAPSDEIALDTLTAFLGAVLAKKYTNPSSDILSVLAGLSEADSVLTELVSALDTTIRSGRDSRIRGKAVRVALSIASGAYSTGVLSYLTHRDLFPSLMKLIQDSELPGEVSEPFILLGLLVNYNKFEFQNPYRLRLDDFVNDAAIKKTVQCVGSTCRDLRDAYVAVQDDTPETSLIGTALSYVGLGGLAGARPTSPTPTSEDARALFSLLPGPDAAILLAAYDFANANKLFCSNLINLPAESKTDPAPFNSFLSLTSYLSHHAHRSARTALYTHVTHCILQIIVEDPTLARRICSDESKTWVKLCRQRQPYLPIVRTDRVLAACILDVMIDGINHNLRRRLDTDYYILCLGIILRIVSFVARSRIRLAYHWSELWRSLLSFTKFLTTYANDIKLLREHKRLIDDTVNLIALSLSAGESFLPDADAYDDLFYKLVETGDILARFREVYGFPQLPSPSSIDTLVGVSTHYHALLQKNEMDKPESKTLSPKEVSRVIRQGYETLSIQAGHGLDYWEPYREANHKAALKKVSRAAVVDAKVLAGRQ